MPDDGARPSSGALRTMRDAILLLVVAVVLVAGLVHYGDRLRGQDDSRSHQATPVTSATPSEAAQLESGPPADPDTAPVVVTCWNGRTVATLSMCTLPTGSAGLRWVYPSLAADPSCHRATRPAGHYRTVVGWECFARAAGRPVAISYEQVTSVDAAERAIERSYAGARQFTLPGAHGGRCTWFDTSSRPVRVTGLYEQFPYVVSVYAPTPQAAKAAWATLVQQRSPRAIRGLPA